jgi:hypothetical protein
LSPAGGIETVANFNYNIDELNIAMRGTSNSALTFFDTTVNSAPAVAISNSADPSHGVVLLNPGESAASLHMNTTFVGAMR